MVIFFYHGGQFERVGWASVKEKVGSEETMEDVKLLKVMMSLEGEPRIFECPAIDYDGAVWLVPRWLPTSEEGYLMPERLIQLDQFAHQKLGQTGDPADFAINFPVPKALFAGPISHELLAQFVVLDRPAIRVRAGGTVH